MPVNNPTNHGWKEEDGKLLPIWTTLPFAKGVFHLDVKCTCSVTCSQCKCMKTKLKCSLHISASSHARSSWSRTISNRLTGMYIGALVIFLLNALFKDLFQAIV